MGHLIGSKAIACGRLDHGNVVSLFFVVTFERIVVIAGWQGPGGCDGRQQKSQEKDSCGPVNPRTEFHRHVVTEGEDVAVTRFVEDAGFGQVGNTQKCQCLTCVCVGCEGRR
jgi:hypothetical protein